MEYHIDGKQIFIYTLALTSTRLLAGLPRTAATHLVGAIPVFAAAWLVRRRFRPTTKPFSAGDMRAGTAWKLIVTAMIFMHLGAVAAEFAPTPGGYDVAHVLTGLSYPTLALGVFRLARLCRTLRTREVLLDGAAIGLTALGGAWGVLTNAIQFPSLQGDLTAWTYPIGAATLLCTAVWLTLLPNRDCWATRALIAFFAWTSALDFMTSVAPNTEILATEAWLRPLGFLLVVVALTTADRAALEDPEPVDYGPLPISRFVVLALPLLVSPLITVENIRAEGARPFLHTAVSSLVACIVLVRFWGVLQRSQAQHMALTYQSEHDGLTGLLNRNAYVQKLQDMLSSPVRTPGAIVWVIFLDVDDFKKINDEFGHRRGDAVLRVLAKRLEKIPSIALASRLGGDEFALAFEATRCKAHETARLVVDLLGLPFEIDQCDLGDGTNASQQSLVLQSRASDVIRKAHLLSDQFAKHRITVSIGLAGVASGSSSSSELLGRADRAMYKAKVNGGGQWVEFDDALQRELEGNRELELALERAVNANDLDVAYQPIFDLASTKIMGFEALARWRSEEYGLVSPEFFIQLAERSSLIHRLGLNVLEHSLRELAVWNSQRGDQSLSLSVNVSSRQFESPAFVQDVVERVILAGVSPHQVILEITERLLMEDVDATLGILNELRYRGIRVAVDDFGIGYSSLAYLETFPIDVLKIDRALINRVGADTSSVSVVSASIDLGHALGMKVTAEGVERREQIDGLRRLGCDSAQGYHLGRPCSAIEARILACREQTEQSSRSPSLDAVLRHSQHGLPSPNV